MLPYSNPSFFMLDSTRAFLAHLIDYAGMFPPASLPLDTAIRLYATYQSSEDAWMLGRFICFGSQLGQLDAYQDLFDDTRPLKLSVLAAKNPTRDNFLEQLETSHEQIKSFHAKWGTRATVDAVEISLPVGFVERYAIHNWFPETPAVFVEVPLIPGGSSQLSTVFNQLVQASVGFKLRTGGIIASAFPTSAQVADAIVGCRERGVRMKCTAGLHHPLRRFDASVQTEMHGFVNVFGAGILAHVHSPSAEVIQSILDDSDAKHFRFDQDGFAWRNLRATTEEISRVRRDAMLSFGSCSFDEPRADLRALGWL
jgi:hypothetical protein